MAQASNTERRYVIGMALLAAFFAAFPALYASLVAPEGAVWLGVPVNTDDHMVYAAWMRQAMDGRFLFDNRFAVDAQPGLTIHLYFLVTGWLAKLTGIPIAMMLARVAGSVAFVFLLHRLIRKVVEEEYLVKLSLALSLLGGGLGFLAWHHFGVAFSRPGTEGFAALTGGLPVDVWQPEAFVFPSLMTAGLFSVSLCLIVFTFLCVLDARESKRAVLPGAIAFAVLMNIHSYDVLLVTLVLIGFLVMRLGQKDASKEWITRAALIGAGAILPALWFVFVLQRDTVFQARAATETFSPAFRQLLGGILTLFFLSLIGFFVGAKESRAKTGAGIGVLLSLVLWGLSAQAGSAPGYFMNGAGFVVVFAAVLALLWHLRSENIGKDLVVSWAWVGLVAPFFPALFQRKLAMGLALPWAILAAIGVGTLLLTRERSLRNLVTVFLVTVCAGSSLMWVFRVKRLTDDNVSSTTVHAVYLSRDLDAIIRELNGVSGRKVVLAMPGVANPDRDQAGNLIPDSFSTPVVPDWNPFLAGMTGAYAYAGHWSETPDYMKRRDRATRVFLAQTSDEERQAILEEIDPDFIVAPLQEAYGADQLADIRPLGRVRYEGVQFALIERQR